MAGPTSAPDGSIAGNDAALMGSLSPLMARPPAVTRTALTSPSWASVQASWAPRSWTSSGEAWSTCSVRSTWTTLSFTGAEGTVRRVPGGNAVCTAGESQGAGPDSSAWTRLVLCEAPTGR